MSDFVDSSNLVEIVYRPEIPGLDDPAENYFQASKLSSETILWDIPGASALEQSAELREMTTRAARRYASRPTVWLPPDDPPDTSLVTALSTRRSVTSFNDVSVRLEVVAGILRHSYGFTGWQGRHAFRATPSAGALFPLDVFVVARAVEGLRAGGLYHFDPFRDALGDLGDVDLDRVSSSMNPPEPARTAALTLVVSATFWRSRFKYGQRALRFCLMESGHLVQNALLLATAYGLESRPMGGFLDDELTSILPDHNGVDDAPIYPVLLGSPAD